MLKVTCPHCRCDFILPQQALGIEVNCSNCGKDFFIEPPSQVLSQLKPAGSENLGFLAERRPLKPC